MRLAGVHTVKAGRPGTPIRWYIYAWRGGPRIGLRVGGTKPVALLATEESAYRTAKVAQVRQPVNTVSALTRDYRVSPEWAALADNTKKQWSRHLGLIESRWGNTALDVMADRRMVPYIIAWRDERAATPRAADYQVGVLRALLGWGLLRGRLSFNPAQNIPTLYKGADRAKIVWSAEEVSHFTKNAPQQLGDVVRLAAATGFRAADLAGLQWDEVEDCAINRTALKKTRGRRRNAVVPLTPATRSLLDELGNRRRADGVTSVLVNSFGQPWSAEGLSGSVAAEIKRLDIRHDDGRLKHLHDLRGTFATTLFAAGLSDEEAAEILAWSPSQVASIRHHYVDRERRIMAMAKRLEAAVVKPGVKPEVAEQLN